MLFADHRLCRRRASAPELASRTPRRTGPSGLEGEPRPIDAVMARVSSEGGFLLVEVIISALLVAIIVVATFNGFDAANRLTIDQRRHAEAALLASESQEKLRTDPATALDALETAPHKYEVEVGATKYKVTQEAKPVNGGGSSTGCSVNESSRENGANIQISSSVTWALHEAAKQPPVKQSTIITPPVGSALEVDVSNGGSPKLAAAGVTASAKYTPVGSSFTNTAEGTTGAAGCVILTGLAATSATVEIAEKPNFVTTGGTLKYPTKEVSIAPNITTQYAVSYDEGGRITAEYTYKGETSFEGQPVTGNTFVVSSEFIPAGDPTFQTGSQEFKYQGGGEEKYEAVTTTAGPTATTAAGAKYAKGDLFPFSAPWTVYAGDCPNNGTYKEAEVPGGAVVTPGSNPTVKVPLSRVNLTVNDGTYAKPGTVESVPAEVSITNTECEGSETPNNAFAASLVHAQLTNSSGHLEHQFQPFGKAKLCVYDKAAKRAYTANYTNSNAEGTTLNAYFGQRSKAEREAEEAPPRKKRETEETEAKTAKTKRETEETEAKTAKETRETEEATQASAKTTREAKEAKERKEWLEKEEGKKLPKISKAEREAKEKAQTTTRETDEKNETKAKEKRATEEATAQTAKEKREKEETEATTAKEKRTKEETEAKALKATREKEETEAEEKTSFSVASGVSSC